MANLPSWPRRVLMGRVAFGFLVLAAAAAATPASANEAVIRGGAISFPQAGTEAQPYSGSSLPPASRTMTTTILRGTVPGTRQTPASDLGGDVDGPVYNPPCLYANPPTCR